MQCFINQNFWKYYLDTSFLIKLQKISNFSLKKLTICLQHIDLQKLEHINFVIFIWLRRNSIIEQVPLIIVEGEGDFVLFGPHAVHSMHEISPLQQTAFIILKPSLTFYHILFHLLDFKTLVSLSIIISAVNTHQPLREKIKNLS